MKTKLFNIRLKTFVLFDLHFHKLYYYYIQRYYYYYLFGKDLTNKVQIESPCVIVSLRMQNGKLIVPFAKSIATVNAFLSSEEFSIHEI
jgi:hypothetical protein